MHISSIRERVYKQELCYVQVGAKRVDKMDDNLCNQFLIYVSFIIYVIIYALFYNLCNQFLMHIHYGKLHILTQIVSIKEKIISIISITKYLGYLFTVYL